MVNVGNINPHKTQAGVYRPAQKGPHDLAWQRCKTHPQGVCVKVGDKLGKTAHKNL